MATDVWTRGVVGEFKKYDIQTVEINPNDVNRQVLEGMTVLRKGTTEVSLIEDPVDVNKIFDEIMKGQPNGFLH